MFYYTYTFLNKQEIEAKTEKYEYKKYLSRSSTKT
jgi:hypothetical protein